MFDSEALCKEKNYCVFDDKIENGGAPKKEGTSFTYTKNGSEITIVAGGTTGTVSVN